MIPNAESHAPSPTRFARRAPSSPRATVVGARARGRCARSGVDSHAERKIQIDCKWQQGSSSLACVTSVFFFWQGRLVHLPILILTLDKKYKSIANAKTVRLNGGHAAHLWLNYKTRTRFTMCWSFAKSKLLCAPSPARNCRCGGAGGHLKLRFYDAHAELETNLSLQIIIIHLRKPYVISSWVGRDGPSNVPRGNFCTPNTFITSKMSNLTAKPWILQNHSAKSH